MVAGDNLAKMQALRCVVRARAIRATQDDYVSK
jgi:hypothetical protein